MELGCGVLVLKAILGFSVLAWTYCVGSSVGQPCDVAVVLQPSVTSSKHLFIRSQTGSSSQHWQHLHAAQPPLMHSPPLHWQLQHWVPLQSQLQAPWSPPAHAEVASMPSVSAPSHSAGRCGRRLARLSRSPWGPRLRWGRLLLQQLLLLLWRRLVHHPDHRAARRCGSGQRGCCRRHHCCPCIQDVSHSLCGSSPNARYGNGGCSTGWRCAPCSTV